MFKLFTDKYCMDGITFKPEFFLEMGIQDKIWLVDGKFHKYLNYTQCYINK